jgi:hypothetical protein
MTLVLRRGLKAAEHTQSAPSRYSSTDELLTGAGRERNLGLNHRLMNYSNGPSQGEPSMPANASCGALRPLITAILASQLPGLASAQTNSDDAVTSLENVVVTARRREESLQDVPVAIYCKLKTCGRWKT